MSYDLRVLVKADGCGKFVPIATPEYDNPTYNLRNMFVACMDWDYEQSKVYPAETAMPHIERGIHELTFNSKEYRKYDSPNGWGTLEGARECLISWWECILETSEQYEIPLNDLYVSW